MPTPWQGVGYSREVRGGLFLIGRGKAAKPAPVPFILTLTMNGPVVCLNTMAGKFGYISLGTLPALAAAGIAFYARSAGDG